MRTASCLTLLAIGAILTFAVTGSPSFLNLQVAGVVIMATGVAGMFVRRPTQGWLRRRTVLRDRTRGGRIVGRVDETRYPPYVMLNPGASVANDSDHGPQPGDLTAGTPGSDTVPDVPAQKPTEETQDAGIPGVPAETEVVDEYIEELFPPSPEQMRIPVAGDKK
jgi:hypothetical protein